MQGQGTTKKLLIVAVVALLLGTGLLVFNTNRAEATCPTGPCIATGTFTAAITQFGSNFNTALEQAQEQITAKFSTTMNDFTSDVKDKIKKVTENVTKWIEDFWANNMDPAMKDMTDQMMAITADQQRQLASMRDAAEAGRELDARNEQEILSHREYRVDENGCLVATVSGGMTRAAEIRRAYNAAASASRLPRTINSKGTAAATGTAADMRERWNEYVTRYCDKDDNNGAAGCATSGAFANQDVDVAGTIFQRETIDLRNENTRRTVDDLVTNIAEPFVKNPIAPAALDSPNGQRALIETRAYAARRQAVYDALYHVVARRAPGSKMDEPIRALRKRGGIPDNLISDNPSHNEIMHAMMSERYRSGKYTIEQIDEPENNQREMILQQALQIMHLNDQLDLLDRYALVLAGQVSNDIKKTREGGSGITGAPLK